MAVASDSPDPCTPCGVCRQVLREFCSASTVFLLPSQKWAPCADARIDAHSIDDLAEDDVLILTMEQLLPHSFGPEALQGA